ncbi:MAG: MIP/aquaporin family protein [bacterium]
MIQALREHWPEYLMEASLLGLFMISAGMFGTLLEYPDSPVRQMIGNPLLRRVIMGLVMGSTAIILIYSPWGQQSGAHFNPAVTLTFLRLGKVAKWDAVFYIIAQFIGGLAGVLIVKIILDLRFTEPPVLYVATLPGPAGEWVAFIAEVVISFGLMTMILFATNSKRLHRFTGIFAGILVASYIAIEAPISGMSMNPARTFASALPSGLVSLLWIYFTAPVIGMLLAVEMYRAIRKTYRVVCAKINHHTTRRCIFSHCLYPQMMSPDADKSEERSNP